MLEEEKIGTIDSIEAFLISIPLLKPFETSFGVKTEKDALIIRIQSGELAGWAECSAFSDPFYSYETTYTALYIIKDFLAPLIKNSITVKDMLKAFKHVRGHAMAKAVLENAVLNLIAERKEVPLYSILGGEKKKILAGVSFGIQKSDEDLLNVVQWAVEKKFHKIKVKIKKGKDIQILKVVREKFPEINLMADANADYTINDFPLLKEFDEFKLMMLEQPLAFDDMYQHSLLQKEVKTPICLDESIESLDDAKAAIAMKSCKIINIKQGRVGGLIESSLIADYSSKAGIDVWSGAMIETGIGRAYNYHIQTIPGYTLPGDNSGTVPTFVEDLTEPQMTLDNEGYMEIPEGTGLCFKVYEDRIDKYCTYRENIL